MKGTAFAIEAANLTLGRFFLHNIDLALEDGEILVLLGPNGAGKSICLEMIAGFHRPATGRIMIRGREVTDLPPEQRRVGLVFQNFGLFPHLTVVGNIAFAVRARCRAGHAKAGDGIAELLAQFGIQHLSGRYPQDLSPGEKQRVALARALAARPDLFLFDEPFSALDARTRVTLRDELKALLRQSGVPAIFVSHDQADAALLADRVAVMDRGEIQQVGSVPRIFRQPANIFVAEFTGMENLLPGRLLDKAGDLRRVQVADKILYARGDDSSGTDALLCIRAEEIGLRVKEAAGSLGLQGATNRIAGRVIDATSLGVISRVTVDCGFTLVAYLTQRDMRGLGLAPGLEVVAQIETGSIHLLRSNATDPGALRGEPRSSDGRQWLAREAGAELRRDAIGRLTLPAIRSTADNR
jgi:molybdate/tungstate transport system ATP-binding protein